MKNVDRNGKEVANQESHVLGKDLDVNNTRVEDEVKDSQSSDSGEEQFFNAKERQQRQQQQGSEAEGGADLKNPENKLEASGSTTKVDLQIAYGRDSEVRTGDNHQENGGEDKDEISQIEPADLGEEYKTDPSKKNDEDAFLPHTTNNSNALALDVMPSSEALGFDDVEEELKAEVKIEALDSESKGSKGKEKRKENEAEAEEFPHLFFTYGVDMLTFWLEELCEKAFRAREAKEKEDAELQAEAVKAAENTKVQEIPDSDADLDCALTESDEACEEQEERGRRVPRGKQEDVEDLYKYYKRTHENHSRDWSDQYQMVGLGRLNDFVWIIDEFGEAKIFASCHPGPAQAPQGDLISSKESSQPSAPEATKNRTDDLMVPPDHETMGWIKEDWMGGLLERLPPTPTPSPKEPEGPHKLDSVYGIIYRMTPYLYTLLQEHHRTLLPMEPARLARYETQLTVSYLERSWGSATAGWNAPLFFREKMVASAFVSDGMSWKEKNKRGLKVLLGDMAKRVAFNKAVTAVCSLACPDGWIEDVVRQYVPVPRNGQDAGLWY